MWKPASHCKTTKLKGHVVPCIRYERNNKANGFNSSKEYVGGIHLLQFFLSDICRSDYTHNVSIKLLLEGVFIYAY